MENVVSKCIESDVEGRKVVNLTKMWKEDGAVPDLNPKSWIEKVKTKEFINDPKTVDKANVRMTEDGTVYSDVQTASLYERYLRFAALYHDPELMYQRDEDEGMSQIRAGIFCAVEDSVAYWDKARFDDKCIKEWITKEFNQVFSAILVE